MHENIQRPHMRIIMKNELGDQEMHYSLIFNFFVADVNGKLGNIHPTQMNLFHT